MSGHEADGELWILRHGETEWSKSMRHTGRTDLDLTAEGEQEARDVRPYLEGVDFDRVVVSPLLRARRTAELAGLEAAEFDDRVMEWDYGDVEGRTTAELREEIPGWAVWTHGSTGGESVEDIRIRADQFLADATQWTGRNIVVAHGQILRAIAARWVGQEVAFGAHLHLATAQLGILGRDRSVPTIDGWNLIDRRH